MRLSLRLLAERSARPGALGEYLDDPVLLFAPVRLLLAVVLSMATVLMAPRHRPVRAAADPHDRRPERGPLHRDLPLVVLPRLLVIGDPERVLEALLPSFRPVARVLRPIANWIPRHVLGAHEKGVAFRAGRRNRPSRCPAK